MTLEARLIEAVGASRVKTRLIDRVACASDASFYRLIPRAVVRAASIAHVQALFRISQDLRVPLTFRAAGTSLSGQAVTDGILVDVSKDWRTVRPMDDGARVWVQPGVIGERVNIALRRYGRRMGPDPASIASCMMGGILSNNSSGMCCGVVNNAYHTLDSMVFVLPSGVVVDTSLADADERFHAQAPEIAAGLLALRDRLRADGALAERVRAHYKQKNTTGYSINAFLDYERAVDIMAHLVIGGEGTLAFIAEAVLRTIEDPPLRHTCLLFFPDIRTACEAITPLVALDVAAAEVMDRPSLRAVEDQAGIPPEVAALPDDAAAILVEWQCRDRAELSKVKGRATRRFKTLPLVGPALVAADDAERAALWHVRKGMYPSVGARRASGTSLIAEDVCFPLDRLADGVVGLQALFMKHDYPEGIVFGHARDGNLHFAITQSFNTPEKIKQFEDFTDDLVRLVVDLGGALKAEHGTGRNMAPFVEAEWGREAYAIMRELKALVDPHGMLNPGVIINDDPRAHLKDLKALPTVEAEVDRCVECGFCESRCPSRDVTLTPRQRIVVRREMAALSPTSPAHGELARDYAYDALDTCATDGLCATACPVAIDTGLLVKRLRAEGRPAWERWLARGMAWGFSAVEAGARFALTVGHFVGARQMQCGLTFLRRWFGPWIPSWPDAMPLPAPDPPPGFGRDFVYFPSCVSRVLGNSPAAAAEATTPYLLATLAKRAGLRLRIPAAHGLCCGMPFSSKGYLEAHADMANRICEAMYRWSEGGKIPIVTDNSSCAFSLRKLDGLSEENVRRYARLTILDLPEFARRELLGRLSPRALDERVVLHPVCSAIKLGSAVAVEAVARACAARVEVPTGAGCCGFAGDRGLLYPELTAAATRTEAAQARDGFDGWYASNRTCEMAMEQATGRPYRSFLSLLERATR